MAKWSLKNRDSENKPPEMPPAAENYYRAEKRDRMVGVWLLGLATLAVTAVLAFLLFLGGRWVYQQLTDDTNGTETTQNEQGEAPAAADGEAVTDGNGTDTDANGDGVADSAANGAADGDSAQDDQAQDGQEVAGTTGKTNDEEGVVSDEAATTDLPNTGPAETIALFLGVTIVASLIHRTMLVRE